DPPLSAEPAAGAPAGRLPRPRRRRLLPAAALLVPERAGPGVRGVAAAVPAGGPQGPGGPIGAAPAHRPRLRDRGGLPDLVDPLHPVPARSEERRVGKELKTRMGK